MDIEQIVKETIDCAYEVKNILKKGYIENVYKNALAHELRLRGHLAEVEKPIKVSYKGIVAGEFRADILVDEILILELKATSQIIDAHCVQLVNYLTGTGIDHGLVINFGSDKLEIKRKWRIYKKTSVSF